MRTPSTAARALVATAVIASVVLAVRLATSGAREATLSESVNPPSAAVLTLAARTSVFFGHQSVGGNVIDGIGTVYSLRNVPAPTVVETTTPPSIGSRATFAHALIGVNGDPEAKMRDFSSALAGPLGDSVQVALLKLCYVDITAAVDVDALFAQYRSTMASLERDHPDIRFLYATVPLTTDGGVRSTLKALLGRDDQVRADNVARERFNRLVRDEYAGTARLWDVAAVESTAPDGSRVTGMYAGEPYFGLLPGYAADPGHLNESGSAAAASALLPLIAAGGKG